MPNVQQTLDTNLDYVRRRGERLNQDAEGRANVARQGRAAYQAYADEVYDPLIGGRGGYSQEEADRIYREGDVAGAMARPEDLDANFMTPEEYAQSQGRPWDRAAYFDPESDTARTYESSGRQRVAVDQFGREMTGAIGNDLGVDTAYTDQAGGVISGTVSRMRGAVDPTRLRADQAALERMRMSPEEQQRLVTQAGTSAGVRYRAATDDALRRGRAAGMNPQGLAAVRSQNERNAGVDAADAMTMARIRASDAAAQRAGMAENYRMRGEESAADRVGDMESRAGQFEFGARSSMEDRRMGAARDVSNRRMGAAESVGRARIGTEADTANQEAAGRRFNTQMGTDIATGIERDTVARATDTARNRQQVNQGNVATRYSQRMGGADMLSGQAQTVANQRLRGAEEGRDYLRGQMAGARADEQADYNRQVGIYGTQGGLQNQAANTAVAYDQRPRWWERAVGAGANAVRAGAAAYGAGK